jgi:amino acid transporter
MGIVASICAFAFAKLSRFHNSDSNGGSYLYTRSALGRFPGILVAVMQYLMIPFTLAQQIFNMLRACFSPSWAGMAPGSKDFP